MKKISLLVMILMLTLTLTGCGSKNVEGTLEEIIDRIYENVPEDQMPRLEKINVLEMAPDNVEYYIGTTDIEYEEILASEPPMTSMAYSVVLVRIKDGADIEDAKTKIKENVNPRKWLCVDVPREEIIVKNKGNLIILIMVQEEFPRDEIEAGFDNL